MNSYGAEVALSNKFPGKLWRMVNNCKSGAISWGQGGRTIIIHQTKFQDEFLQEESGLFKTANIGSFIRQLNLYGFRKLNILRYAESGSELREIHEFQNDFFVQGRAELLSRLRRNVGIRRSREASDMKRQLDEIHGYANKKSYLELQNGNYVTIPSTSYPFTHCQRHSAPATNSNGTAGSQGSTQQYGQWPVYMQWDGHGYKYVVHPETNRQKTFQKTTTLQSLLQPSLKTKRPAQEAGQFQVLHIPEAGGGEPTKEYVLLSLMSEDSSSQDEVPNETNQEENHEFQSMKGNNSNTNQPEYSQAELYQLADMLASNPQCAIAAAQQLLAQANQEESLMSEKGDLGTPSWLSPPTSPPPRHSTPTVLSDVKLEPTSPEQDLNTHCHLLNDVKFEPVDESPLVVMSTENISPRVIVTANEDTCRSPNLCHLLHYSDHLGEDFLQADEGLGSEEEAADCSLNLIVT